MVIEFTVLHRHDRPLLVSEGLMTAGDVNDRQPAHAKRYPWGLVYAPIVRPTRSIMSVICTRTDDETTSPAAPPS